MMKNDTIKRSSMISQEIEEKFRWVVIVRFVAASSILSVFAIIRIKGWLEFPFLLFSIAPLFEMFVNQPYSWIVSRVRNYERVFIVNLILDIFMITWGVHFLGGMDVFVTLLVYPLVFIFAGIVLRPKITYLMANLSFIAYASMVYLEYHGIISRIPSVNLAMADNVRLLFTLLVLPLYNIIAFYVSFLTGSLRESKEELKRSSNEYLSIASLTGDIIMKVDKENRMIFLNDGACQFWGRSRKELSGRYFIDYLHDSDLKTTLDAVERLKKREIVKGLVNRQRTAEGWRTVEWNEAAFFDEEGNYEGFQATGRDITEHIEREEMLRRNERELKRKIDELEKIHSIAADRELQMAALKIEIGSLRTEIEKLRK